MCGISGIVAKDGSPVASERIRRITDLVTHRGPDDSGYHFDRGLALGHRRLSILDLSPRGRQPMALGDRYRITYNGEVYNYLEIKRELEDRGVAFHTTTDSEVVLAAYAAWGPACLTRFNGMWAFAILDREERILFLARDRFGVKPLYYLDDPRQFVFGSELKQLVALQPRVQANRRMLVEYLTTHLEGHTDETFFEGVRAVPQGHHLLYSLTRHDWTIQRWYELGVNLEARQFALPEATRELRRLLEDSVRLRLRSDVTVGTCLSGGLDSSATSAIASRQYHDAAGRRFRGVHAKSIEARTDESEWAHRTADFAGIDLHVVEPSTADFVASVDEVVYTQEEPFGSPSMFMGWHVFRDARALDCRVMLNGQGGDEVLLGYERYYAAILGGLSPFRFLPEAWRQARNSRLGFAELLQYYAYFTNPDLRIRRLKARSPLRREVLDAHDFGFVRESARSFRSVEDLQRYEISTLQLPHLLRYEDRNSMRHSVETRLPFLDYRLVEAAVSMPTDLKIHGGWTKYVLRIAVEDLLPADVVWRKNKLGFEAPERTWIDAHAPEMRRQIAASSILAEIADVRRILDGFERLSLKERWAFFNVAAWERVYDVAWA